VPSDLDLSTHLPNPSFENASGATAGAAAASVQIPTAHDVISSFTSADSNN